MRVNPGREGSFKDREEGIQGRMRPFELKGHNHGQREGKGKGEERERKGKGRGRKGKGKGEEREREGRGVVEGQPLFSPLPFSFPSPLSFLPYLS